MTAIRRVLHPNPDTSLDVYVARGGLGGLTEAQHRTADEIIDIVAASGLRGRGGAGFPTGRKWRTVAGNSMGRSRRASLIVNGAEGEPGTFKDRSIIRGSPFVVLEGAMIAARAVGADFVAIALKESFSTEVDLIEVALHELKEAGYGTDLEWLIFQGPDEYLYGEESALLETIDGRFPFPRNVPTFRSGVSKATDYGWPPPALVNNVETIANVPRILAHGSDWFRRVGTDASPGSVICTVTGTVERHGVGEFQMGTPLRTVLEDVGGGPLSGPIKAVLSGVANPVILDHQLDAPVSYEGLGDIGAGLGSAGFIVFDQTVDMVAVAAGVARFLAVESCGQCSPCKYDGIKLSELLAAMCRSRASQHDLEIIRRRASSVSIGARCYLGVQQELVITSILANFQEEFQAHIDGTASPVEPMLIAELLDIRDGEAIVDERHLKKQPDWSFDERYSWKIPVDVLRHVSPRWSQ